MCVVSRQHKQWFIKLSSLPVSSYRAEDGVCVRSSPDHRTESPFCFTSFRTNLVTSAPFSEPIYSVFLTLLIVFLAHYICITLCYLTPSWFLSLKRFFTSEFPQFDLFSLLLSFSPFLGDNLLFQDFNCLLSTTSVCCYTSYLKKRFVYTLFPT